MHLKGVQEEIIFDFKEEQVMTELEFNEKANRFYTKHKGIVITCILIAIVLAFVLSFVIVANESIQTSDGHYIVYEQLQNGQVVARDSLFVAIRTGICFAIIIVALSISIFKKWPKGPGQT